jgi:hypothetical protein
MSRAPRSVAALAAAALVAPAAGCEFAVKHPGVTAGLVGGSLGFGTCKLASDNYGACLAVGGGAGAFLGLVAATAMWLAGDASEAGVPEEQAQPLPEDSRPRRKRRRPAADPAAVDPAAPPPAATDPAATPHATPPPSAPTPPAATPPAATPPAATPPAATPPPAATDPAATPHATPPTTPPPANPPSTTPPSSNP